jgi:hypothetical protein
MVAGALAPLRPCVPSFGGICSDMESHLYGCIEFSSLGGFLHGSHSSNNVLPPFLFLLLLVTNDNKKESREYITENKFRQGCLKMVPFLFSKKSYREYARNKEVVREFHNFMAMQSGSD